MNVKRLIIFICLSAFTSLAAETKQAFVKEAQKHLNQVGIHQLGFGIDIGGWRNLHTGCMLHYTLGSNRNLFNLNTAVGYKIISPINIEYSPECIGHYIPISFGVHYNYFRWQKSCLYLNAEGMCNVNVGNQYVHQTFFSLGGGMGIRQNALDIQARFDYNMNPHYNQKYIYESNAHDFNALHNTIYERMQMVVRVAYYFTLDL